MRVLLTGGTGYLGRAIARALAARGHEVVVFSRHASGSGVPGTPFDGDVRNADDLRRAAAGCEGLVHTAALVSIWQRRRAGFRRRQRRRVAERHRRGAGSRNFTLRLHFVVPRTTSPRRICAHFRQRLPAHQSRGRRRRRRGGACGKSDCESLPGRRVWTRYADRRQHAGPSDRGSSERSAPGARRAGHALVVRVRGRRGRRTLRGVGPRRCRRALRARR